MLFGSLGKAVVCTAVVLLGSGCGGEKSSVRPDSAAELCSGPITVTVSGGATPTFSWSPACKATNLLVVRTDAPATDPVIWATGASQGFGPSVQYGVAPTGTSGATPKALETGVQYRVSVYVMIGGDVEGASGAATFMP